MLATFSVSDLIGIFRAGLIALIPVAERARIVWRGPQVWDPWQDIEQALFASIVASVVDNAVPGPLRPLPKYGWAYGSYADGSFITERAARLRGECLVFDRLLTVHDPFDIMRFLEVDADFAPTTRMVELRIPQALPELAGRTSDGIRYLDTIDYDE